MANTTEALKKAREALEQAYLQIEYLHGKYQATGSGNAVCAEINCALDAITAASAEEAQPVEPVTVPEGWKLVPVEPTPEMLKAATADEPGHSGTWDNMNPPPRHAYRAMLAAAPAAPVAQAQKSSEKDAERHRWLANRVLACDYGDNETHGQQIGWRIRHDLLAKNGQRQPAFMFGDSINNAIDAAIAKEQANQKGGA